MIINLSRLMGIMVVHVTRGVKTTIRVSISMSIHTTTHAKMREDSCMTIDVHMKSSLNINMKIKVSRPSAPLKISPSGLRSSPPNSPPNSGVGQA